MQLDKQELDARRARFCRAMDISCPDWDTALIVNRINQYYLTGTMQDALLIISRDGRYAMLVRRSFTRAAEESPLPHVFSMNSYRDAAQTVDSKLGRTYIESESMPYALLERLRKYFDMTSVGNMEQVIRNVRAVKSPYELYWMEQSGIRHDRLLTEEVPPMLKEGMSEAELHGKVLERMMSLGYHGVSRFTMFQIDVVAGQMGFGENSLYPACFNGAGGMRGAGAAAPQCGNPERKLKKGDLVFLDIAFGVNGYHTDKTQIYSFGAPPSEEASAIHRACMDVQRRAADMLRPGVKPSGIYRDCLDNLPDILKSGFMGFGDHCVRFIGHGVGLYVDDLPVIADGFDVPLEEGITIALEPKKGLAGQGILGAEDTYAVTPDGGRCLTVKERDIITV